MQLETGKLEIGRLDKNVGECVYSPMVLSSMPVRSVNLAQAREVFAEHKGMLRTSEALRFGIHPRTLYALRDTPLLGPVRGRTAERRQTRNRAEPLSSKTISSMRAFSPLAALAPRQGQGIVW